MNIERLRRIMEYSAANRKNMESKVQKFYAFTGIGSDKDVLNILQIVRPAFWKKRFLILELPFSDDEIGALCYKGDALGYILLNTSLPKANVNFAVCHEIYHVFYSGNEFRSKVEFAEGHYFEHEEELAANLFAGMLLMPETGFCRMYELFCRESKGNVMDTMMRLMNYYQAPYMAVLIRCYELDLPDSNHISEELLSVDAAFVRNRFMELWLDESVLCATRKDDFLQLQTLVENLGKEYVRDSYINERTLKKVLQNIRALYTEIREACL